MKNFVLKRLPIVMSACALLMTFVLLVLGPVGAPAPAAAQGLPADGRINVVAHFGGDAIYCVGSNGLPTSNFSEFQQGGFRVLSENGNQAWWVPASDINPKITEAQNNGGQGVLVAQGQATYGPTSLYVFVDPSGVVNFTYTGVDEWGKTNSLTWPLCLPVGPVPSGHSSNFSRGSEPSCTADSPSSIAGQIQDELTNNPGEPDLFSIFIETCAYEICPQAESNETFIDCICGLTDGGSDFCQTG